MSKSLSVFGRHLLAFLACLLLFVGILCAMWMPQNRNVILAENANKEPINAEDAALEKYNILLKAWSKNPGFLDDRNADFPSFYGGTYIDNSKNLVIQVTEYNDDITDYFASLIDLENVQFSTVERSITDLLYIREQLDGRIAAVDYEWIEGTGISMDENAVNLYTDGNETPDEIAALTADLECIRILSGGLK